MSTKIERLTAIGLLLAVVFTALAFGTVEPWSLALFELLTAGLALLWGAKFIADQQIVVTLPRTALPIAALCVYGFIQGLAFTRGDGVRVSLSADVEATRAATAGLLFLLIAFVIAANVLTSRRRVRGLIITLTGFGLLLAIFALAQHFTWNGRFYWLREASAAVTSPFGPFANHNHFAGYMELLVPLPIALVLTRATRPDARLFLIFAAAVMAVAVVASLSRGGMISLAAELVFIGLMSGRLGETREHSDTAPRRRVAASRVASPVAASLRAAVLMLLIVAAIAAGIYWTGPERVVGRLARTAVVSDDPRAESFHASRGWIWRDTLAMISANPVLGVGLGAYETAYPLTSAEDVMNADGASYSVDRAHNDYLQAVADCGLVGGALAGWFIVLLFGRVRRAAQSSDALVRAMAIGGGAGLFALLVHSLFDFNLQLPANALLFLLIAAVVSHLGEAAHKYDTVAPMRQAPNRAADDYVLVTGVWSR